MWLNRSDECSDYRTLASRFSSFAVLKFTLPQNIISFCFPPFLHTLQPTEETLMTASCGWLSALHTNWGARLCCGQSKYIFRESREFIRLCTAQTWRRKRSYARRMESQGLSIKGKLRDELTFSNYDQLLGRQNDDDHDRRLLGQLV